VDRDRDRVARIQVPWTRRLCLGNGTGTGNELGTGFGENDSDDRDHTAQRLSVEKSAWRYAPAWFSRTY
jgi:hypothetical protein